MVHRSPLSTSRGWVDITHNGFVNIAQEVEGILIFTNGVPTTYDFDLVIYKRDKKLVAVNILALLVKK